MLFDEYDESLKFTSEITQEEIDLKEHIFGMLFINENKLIFSFYRNIKSMQKYRRILY